MSNTYNMQEHTGWGNTIAFYNWETRRIFGWKRGLKVGDKLISKMQSGKTAEFEIIEIEYKRDPSDMFFGYVSDIGYINEEKG